MFNFILLGIVLFHYNHCCTKIMHYRKMDPIFNMNDDLMNLLDMPVVPQIVFVPREKELFEVDEIIFLLNII